jgi:Asp-tRNA(Asn)/Glu-tRNA(Gln) amidotransferase A subunit family amidase
MAVTMYSFDSIKNYRRWLEDHPDGCEQAVHHYLERIREHKNLNAFLEVYEDEALDRARALDKKRTSGTSIGKLHGVVVALKDVIAHEGHLLTAASTLPPSSKSCWRKRRSSSAGTTAMNLRWVPPTRIRPMGGY